MNLLTKRSTLVAISFTGLLSLAACGGGSDDLHLTILHMNDHHSNLDPSQSSLTVNGKEIEAEVGGFPRVVSFMSGFDGRDNVLKLHAGDAMTGTLYHIFAPYEADAALMNEVCFDAFALGNHEFDDSDSGLATFLGELKKGSCQTPVLAANVQPALGTPLAPFAANDFIRPFVIKEVRGRKIGIIGIDIKQKTQVSSRPLETTQFEDEVEAAQRNINILKAQGVERIILLTHQGYERDKAMASQLTGVDVIVGGDSHSLLGEFSGLGFSPEGEYPTKLTNADGKLVCVVQAWENSKVVGQLEVSFDDSGALKECKGHAKLLVGDTFTDPNNDDAPLSTQESSEVLLALRSNPNVAVVSPSSEALLTLAPFTQLLTDKRTEVVGSSSVDLCHLREPGGASRSGAIPACSDISQESRGSDVAQLVAQAFLSGSLAADISIQNAGGVRIALPAGSITYGDALTVLPFSNLLVELKMSGQEIKNVLEEAVSNYIESGGSNGSHPYGAGIRWDLNLTEAVNNRFSNIEVKNKQSGVWEPMDLFKSYVVVTNDFIAEGRDNYLTFAAVVARGDSVENGLLYSQTFIDFLKSSGEIQTINRTEYSHKAVISRAGVVLN